MRRRGQCELATQENKCQYNANLSPPTSACTYRGAPRREARHATSSPTTACHQAISLHTRGMTVSERVQYHSGLSGPISHATQPCSSETLSASLAAQSSWSASSCVRKAARATRSPFPTKQTTGSAIFTVRSGMKGDLRAEQRNCPSVDLGFVPDGAHLMEAETSTSTPSARVSLLRRTSSSLRMQRELFSVNPLVGVSFVVSPCTTEWGWSRHRVGDPLPPAKSPNNPTRWFGQADPSNCRFSELRHLDVR